MSKALLNLWVCPISFCTVFTTQHRVCFWVINDLFAFRIKMKCAPQSSRQVAQMNCCHRYVRFAKRSVWRTTGANTVNPVLLILGNYTLGSVSWSSVQLFVSITPSLKLSALAYEYFPVSAVQLCTRVYVMGISCRPEACLKN